MAKDIPFDDDVMSIIMGIEPSEPGQHGITKTPKPDKDVMGLIIQIKEMCEEFLSRAGEDSEEKEAPKKEDETGDEPEEGDQ